MDENSCVISRLRLMLRFLSAILPGLVPRRRFNAGAARREGGTQVLAS